jgi:hypothetical protein
LDSERPEKLDLDLDSIILGSKIQCYGSGMFIPDFGSQIMIFTHSGSQIPDLGSRIPDPRSKNSNKREG